MMASTWVYLDSKIYIVDLLAGTDHEVHKLDARLQIGQMPPRTYLGRHLGTLAETQSLPRYLYALRYNISIRHPLLHVPGSHLIFNM